MPIKPSLVYEATDTAVDAIPDHRLATLTILTADAADLSILLSRALLDRLRTQVDVALASLPPPAPPAK